MAAEFKHAWDKRTGDKLPYKVPETHFDIFPDTLSPTPLQKRQDRERAASRQADTTPTRIPDVMAQETNKGDN